MSKNVNVALEVPLSVLTCHSIGLCPGCGGSATYDIKLLTGTLNLNTTNKISSMLH